MANIKVWAHRGASNYAPENTIEAFRKAVEMQADGIELDVQMTKDGQLVVLHDETLDRTSTGKGWLKDYTLEELCHYNFNKSYPELGNMAIPTLEEVYQLIKPTDLTINVELKNSVIFYEGMEEKVLALTTQYGLENRVWYSSFNHYSLQRLKQLDPSVRTGMLYADGIVDAPLYAGERIGVDAVHPAIYGVLYPNYMEQCREKQLRVHVWTVNEEAYMRMLCEMQVDALITNDPVLARRVVADYE